MTSLGHVSAGICLVGVLGALLGVARIVGDINQLRNEVESGMGEFKIMAEDTWDRLLILKSPTGESIHAISNLFRQKRHVYAGMCNCNSHSMGCPAGPPGAPGIPGKRGEEGLPGENGKKGASGLAVGVAFDELGGCIKCPSGPEGPQGAPGQPGEDGYPGAMGKAGPAGSDGAPGDDGDVGDKGQPGMPGFDGMNGPDGMPGTVGFPGAQGQPGPIGWPGEQGTPGKNGDNGQDGPDGDVGPPGPPGNNGHEGHPGQPGPKGNDGKIGEDANYCPCPPRGEPAKPPGAESHAVFPDRAAAKDKLQTADSQAGATGGYGRRRRVRFHH